MTEEHRNKLSEAKKRNPVRYWLGKKRSEKTKEKISHANMGNVSWNKGKHTGIVPPNVFKKGFTPWNKGLKMGPNPEHSKRMKGRKSSLETRLKLSESHKGEKSYLWKGGITPKNHKIRTSLEYRLWRTAVFERDNYTCIWCDKKGVELNADHIKPFAYFPELRFAVNNGRTLCIDCHKTTVNYLKKCTAVSVWA